MVDINPSKKLEIKKGQLWELWLVSPPAEIILGAFKPWKSSTRGKQHLFLVSKIPGCI